MQFIDINYVEGLSPELSSLDNRVTILENNGGGGGGSTTPSNIFETVAAAQAFQFEAIPDVVRTEGFYMAGDGGGASYVNPVAGSGGSLGPNLINDGSQSFDTVGAWVVAGNWTINTVAGKAKVTPGQAGNLYYLFPQSYPGGRTYRIEYMISEYVAGNNYTALFNNGTPVATGPTITANGTYTVDIFAPSSFNRLYMIGDSTKNLAIDYVVIREVQNADGITVDVNGSPYTLNRVDDGAINLLQFGLKGDNTNETSLFTLAIAKAVEKGYNKIVCNDPTKTFKIDRIPLSTSLEIDLSGGSLVGDTTIYTDTHAELFIGNFNDTHKFIIRNTIIDGNIPVASTHTDGHPLLLITGGGLIELDNCVIRNGNGRDSRVWDNVFDYLNIVIKITNARRIYVHDCDFYNNAGEVLQVHYTGTNPFQATKLEIERCYMTKARTGSSSLYSNSSIVAYNTGKTSFIRDCVFGLHRNSAINFFGPVTVEGCKFEGVSSSQAIDFDETEKFGIDQIVVRDCFIQDVTGGYAIRGSARNIIIENVEINRCEGGIYLAHAVGSHPQFNGIGVQGSRELYNIFIKNITSNGNDVSDETGAAVNNNSLIRIKGVSQAIPAYVTIEGTGVQLSGTYPSANPEYGIYLENTVTNLSGAFQHGRTAMVYCGGWNNLTVKNARFSPQPGSTTHVIQAGGTVENIVIEDSRVTTALDSGYYHITTANVSNKIWRTRSPTFASLSIGSATLVNTN